ncbi:MAG: prephenate dehydrogenase/arogenate dehydrogenase family protein [Fusicatenibacter sp.]
MCNTQEKVRIGFIGLGLIGGSIAKTLRKVHPDFELMAYCRTKTTIEKAMEEGIIDVSLSDRDDRFGTCDYVFLCAPVSTNISYLPFLKGIVKPGCIITDVGSVKGEIHKAAEALGLTHNFIGGHPMTGSEKTGFDSATDYLLENAYYMITPGSEVEIAALSDFVELVRSLKAIPMVITYEEHDYITAAVSHLPHIVASTLVNALQSLDTPEERMKMIAAGGFKDITRIASSSPEVWQQICLSNQEQISKVLDTYIRILVQAKYLVDHRKAEDLYTMFDQSKEYRDSLPDASFGPTKKAYVLYCDLLDEAGGIAAVTTILAINGINIKNIGIVHNREFEEGVLRIEVYEEDSCTLSEKVLTDHGYTIHRRD